MDLPCAVQAARLVKPAFEPRSTLTDGGALGNTEPIGCRESYAKEGMRRSVHSALLVHSHNHPHILLLKAENPTRFMLSVSFATISPFCTFAQSVTVD